MAYKVNYYTLAIMSDDRIGNIKQETGHVFTEDIPAKLNEHLKAKKRVGVIEKIEDMKGICI